MMNTVAKMFGKFSSRPILHVLFPIIAVCLTFFLTTSALGINCDKMVCDAMLGGILHGFAGAAAAGSTVTASDGTDSTSTTADADGSFTLALGALTISDSTTITVTDGTGSCDIHCSNLAHYPTLAEWVLIILTLSVGGFFVWQLMRRRRAAASV